MPNSDLRMKFAPEIKGVHVQPSLSSFRMWSRKAIKLNINQITCKSVQLSTTYYYTVLPSKFVNSSP